MTVKITASITNEFVAQYEVESPEEALKMFEFIYPEAEVKSVHTVENINTETISAAA